MNHQLHLNHLNLKNVAENYVTVFGLFDKVETTLCNHALPIGVIVVVCIMSEMMYP